MDIHTPQPSYSTKSGEKMFMSLVSQLYAQFPELDLQFTLEAGSSAARYKIADHSDEIYELELNTPNIEDTLYQAIFNIKSITKKFDA